ncbi:putative reverse transcriptase domain-containing protein [Tanacetum coccineum]
MADLGASVNVIPKSMFEHLKLANLKKTDMLFEMADMTKWVPLGIVENVIVKINKFLFPPDFVVIDMLNTRNETMILGRPFLAIIHAEIDVFNKEISLEIRNDRITFDMDKEIYNFMTPVGKGDNTYWWHNHGLKENERQEISLDIEEYDPPEVHVETFEGNDPKRIGHRREDPKKDVKRLESNLKTLIVNGDAPVIASASTEGPIPPKNFEQKLARNNELKAKSTLLLAIPDEHLLKFH